MCINHYYEDTTPCKRLKAGWEVSGNDDQLTILNSSGQLRRSENEAKISLARPTPPKKVAEKCAFSKTLRMRCSIAQSTSHPSTLNIMKPDIGQNRSCDCHHAALRATNHCENFAAALRVTRCANLVPPPMIGVNC